MRRKLRFTVEETVNCGEITCDDCPHKESAYSDFCDLFGDLEYSPSGNDNENTFRHEKCLNWEVKNAANDDE